MNFTKAFMRNRQNAPITALSREGSTFGVFCLSLERLDLDICVILSFDLYSDICAHLLYDLYFVIYVFLL